MELNIDQKLTRLESEILSLKLLLMKMLQKKKLESLRLEGSLNGLEVAEEDIQDAKGSIFKD